MIFQAISDIIRKIHFDWTILWFNCIEFFEVLKVKWSSYKEIMIYKIAIFYVSNYHGWICTN